MKLENIELTNIYMDVDYGLVCIDADQVKIKNLNLKTKHTPAVELQNSANVSVDGLITAEGQYPIVKVSGSQTGATSFINAGITNPEKQLVIGKEVPQNMVIVK
jgi:DNA sulfur modification protein DndE